MSEQEDNSKMSNKEESELKIPGFDTIDNFSKACLSQSLSVTKAFRTLPEPGPIWDIQKSVLAFNQGLKKSRNNLVLLMTKVLDSSKINTEGFKGRDLEEKFEFLVDSNDDILERVGTSLDEVEGLFKRTEAVIVNPKVSTLKPKSKGQQKNFNKERNFTVPATNKPTTTTISTNITTKTSNYATNISNRPVKKANYRLKITEKPQIKFSTPIDNSTSPFVPKLTDKPNSLKPLSILPEYTSRNEEFFGHPYQFELNRWQASEKTMKKTTPLKPKPINKTPFSLIQNPLELNLLISELRQVKEIAVDLEHHSYRTFLGITCTLQISTRDKDYILDGFTLRDSLQQLNEIFTNPKIMKVFHGSSSDVEWLQKDFGIYIVSLFDTYIAAKTLCISQLSLKYLLHHYCQIQVDKSYQLADWRIRPIPDDMLYYARQDTHYLLYIYDHMKNELLDMGNEFGNILNSVYDQSCQLCQKRYEKPQNNPQLALRKTKRNLNNRQVYAYTEIFKWRDQLAREKDESLGYILPNHMLLMISETLPKEIPGILACCDPVPYYVHVHIGHIHKIIKKARDLPLIRPEDHKADNKVESRAKQKNWVVILNSVHDILPEEIQTENYSNSSKLKIKNPKFENVWPQSWSEPKGWKSIPQKKKSTFNFAIRTDNRINKNKSLQIKSTSKEIKNSDPYSRYKISQEILGMLNDPTKKPQVDLEDPLTKTIYDTIFNCGEDKIINEADEDADIIQSSIDKISISSKQEKKKESDDDDTFIPINNLARKNWKEEKKRKKKKPRFEPWDDNK